MELLACQCSRGRIRCETKATQEDLMCDFCREGCTVVMWGQVGGAPDEMTDGLHTRVVSWDFEANALS
jgi:hypothetical protein